MTLDELIYSPVVIATPETRPTPATLAGAFRVMARRPVETDNPDDADAARYALLYWRYLSQEVRKAQVFDYGLIPEPEFRKEAVRGGELIGRGLLETPYEQGIYHYTLTDIMPPTDSPLLTPSENERARYMTVILGPHHPDDAGPTSLGHYFVADFLRLSAEEAGTVRDYVPAGEAEPGSRYWLCAGAAVIETHTEGRWSGHLFAGPLTPDDDATSQARTLLMGSLSDGVAALSMILCTKNIRLRREEPSPKLNAKRAKSGKPPLVLVTHVDARGYFEAAARTEQGGHHASPCPHLRRRHLRTYRNGKQLWIPQMLVNCRSIEEIRPRDHYEVKHDEKN